MCRRKDPELTKANLKTLLSPHPAWIALAAAAVFVTGCTSLVRRSANTQVVPARFTAAFTADTPAIDPAWLERPSFEYRIGPGDVLDIEVIGDSNTHTSSIVGPDGRIYFYLLPGIDVGGLTLPRAGELLNQQLQTLVRPDQTVSLTMRESRSQRVWLLGRLKEPGIYPMAAPMTLLEALAGAGGLEPRGEPAPKAGRKDIRSLQVGDDAAADLSQAFIIREGGMLRVDFTQLLREGDMSQNVYLQPNDVVCLPSAGDGNVRVLGAVKSPRVVAYGERLTLMQAVSKAGGARSEHAQAAHVAIMRGPLAHPQVAVVDLTAIIAGQAPDIALERLDIVFVPDAPQPVLARYVDHILDTFARTVALHEATRTVTHVDR